MRKFSVKNLGGKILGTILAAAVVSSSGVALAGTKAFDKQMMPILSEYLKIPKTLSEDKTDGIKTSAEKIQKLAGKLDVSTVKGEHAKHYRDIPKKLAVSAAKLAKAKNIKVMRDVLKDLSKPMAMWATMSKPSGISVMYCSMAHGSWLQRSTRVANPFYGSKMLRCGEIVAGQGAKNK